MNGTLFKNPTFPNINNDEIIETKEEKNNSGKQVTIYTSFNNQSEWKNKIFTGIYETDNNIYVIISNPKNNKWYMIKKEFIDYYEFDEKINIKNT